MEIKCKECNKFFEITNEEENWYKDKGLSVPKRCKSCRDVRRKEDNYGKKKDIRC